jgi:hypothetical protein
MSMIRHWALNFEASEWSKRTSAGIDRVRVFTTVMKRSSWADEVMQKQQIYDRILDRHDKSKPTRRCRSADFSFISFPRASRSPRTRAPWAPILDRRMCSINAGVPMKPESGRIARHFVCNLGHQEVTSTWTRMVNGSSERLCSSTTTDSGTELHILKWHDWKQGRMTVMAMSRWSHKSESES